MTNLMATGSGPTDFGGMLKQLREARGVALRDIAESTKISVSALEALERNDVSRLPGGIFRRGIIRAYAETIHADAERLVREFNDRFPADVIPAGVSTGGRRAAIAAAVLLPLAALLAWSYLALG
jgi:cytoskeleton protein RodZ